jgi:hypothetical protein
VETEVAVRIRTLVVLLLALLAGSFTSLLADGPCEEFPNIPSPIGPVPNCMSHTWSAWMTAGQNDPNNPSSNIWGGKLVFAHLKDGPAETQVQCTFRGYDKDGESLAYSVLSPPTQTTHIVNQVAVGVGTNPLAGRIAQFDLSSPLPPGSAFIGGPMEVYCRSTDPATLRNKIVVLSSFALYDPQGLKLAEVAEQVKFASSHRWAFPLVEGGDGKNWEHTGIAITNTTTLQKAPSGVTVRISVTDQDGKSGPSRDITLKPPKYDNPAAMYSIRPGETKTYVLWTLFGDKPVEGNALFFPNRDGSDRGQIIYGTVTVESLDPSTTIAVTAIRMFGETGLTAVPVSPVPAP